MALFSAAGRIRGIGWGALVVACLGCGESSPDTGTGSTSSGGTGGAGQSSGHGGASTTRLVDQQRLRGDLGFERWKPRPRWRGGGQWRHEQWWQRWQ